MNFEKPNLKKKETALNRVVGLTPEIQSDSLDEIRENQKKEPSRLFFRHRLPEFVKKELCNADFENTIQEFLARYGLEEGIQTQLEDILTPTFLIHFSDPLISKAIKEKRGRERLKGFHIGGSEEDSVIITKEGLKARKRELIGTIIHEVIHRNSFQSMTVHDDPSSPYSMRRSGMVVYEDDGELSGEWLNEAVIEELTGEYMKEFLNYSGKKSSRQYQSYRDRLNKVIDSIYNKEAAKFNSREDVFLLFSQAVLNGRLLPLARAIEQSEGEGGFKELMKT
jgi:hypothetical protein